MQAGLPPELDALKNTVRQIVKDECYPLEAEFLSNPSQDGVDEPGAPRGSEGKSQTSRAATPLGSDARPAKDFITGRNHT